MNVLRVVAVAGMAGTIAIAGSHLQARQATASEGIGALLEEVRGLRKDLRDLTATSVRAQLLVARVTIQEQRIAGLSRDLNAVQADLAKVAQERLDHENQLRELQKALASDTLTPELSRAMQSELEAVGRRLSERKQMEQQVRGRESEMLSAIDAEQNRWTEFNARLDDLERALSQAGAK